MRNNVRQPGPDRNDQIRGPLNPRPGDGYDSFDQRLTKTDHLTDPRDVPGVLLSTQPIRGNAPGLEDLAPTICGLYGLSPSGMEGRDLFGVV